MSSIQSTTPLRVRFGGRSHKELDAALQSLRSRAIDGDWRPPSLVQWLYNVLFSGSGIWLIAHSQTADRAVVELRRHGALRGAAAHVEVVLRRHPQGGCQVKATGRVPLWVWFAPLVMCLVFWASRLWRSGWIEWTGYEALLLAGFYVVCMLFWRSNLMALARELEQASGLRG